MTLLFSLRFVRAMTKTLDGTAVYAYTTLISCLICVPWALLAEGGTLIEGAKAAIAKVGAQRFYVDLFAVGMLYHLYNQVRWQQGRRQQWEGASRSTWEVLGPGTAHNCSSGDTGSYPRHRRKLGSSLCTPVGAVSVLLKTPEREPLKAWSTVHAAVPAWDYSGVVARPCDRQKKRACLVRAAIPQAAMRV